MAVTDSTKNDRQWALASLLVVCVLPAASLGAEIAGDIRIGISYTDNVFLATAPNETDDTIYQASPHIAITHATPRFSANLDYTFDWYRYSDLSSTSKFHRGEATLVGRTWQDSLETTLGARRSQTLSDPEDVIPSGTLPFSGNLIDEDEYWFNPHLVRSLGRTITLDADYSYFIINYDDTDAQDDDSQFGALSLDNYSAGQGITWALRYNWRRTEYDVSDPWENQMASAELGYWISTTTRIFAGGGKESSWDNPFDPSLEDSRWEAGFAHSAGENLAIQFAAGERTFGSSWRGNIDYTFRRGSTSFSYVESPTSTGFDQPGQSPIVLNPGDLEDFLDSPGSAERYVSKRLEWTVSLEFRRTSFELRLFDDDRSERFAADGSSLDNESESGIRASMSWQPGTRTSFIVNGAIVDQEFAADNKSKWSSAGFTIDYGLGARSSLSLVYSYDEQQPRGQASTSRDYVSNVVSLYFTLDI